ncbi:hypothetical protein ACTXT7_015556, partial [Hymenolepis weldensis]
MAKKVEFLLIDLKLKSVYGTGPLGNSLICLIILLQTRGSGCDHYIYVIKTIMPFDILRKFYMVGAVFQSNPAFYNPLKFRRKRTPNIAKPNRLSGDVTPIFK